MLGLSDVGTCRVNGKLKSKPAEASEEEILFG
jgi:hypothetical protein